MLLINVLLDRFVLVHFQCNQDMKFIKFLLEFGN